jgi:hypothetical protein
MEMLRRLLVVFAPESELVLEEEFPVEVEDELANGAKSCWREA